MNINLGSFLKVPPVEFQRNEFEASVEIICEIDFEAEAEHRFQLVIDYDMGSIDPVTNETIEEVVTGTSFADFYSRSVTISYETGIYHPIVTVSVISGGQTIKSVFSSSQTEIRE